MVWQIVVVWLVAILLGGMLWQRFTRPPGSPAVSVPGQTAVRPRRVLPLWLALVLLIILAAALWLTLRLGATPAS
jgi:hypothetical protein